MLRSMASRSGAAGVRTVSTGSSQQPGEVKPTGANATPTPQPQQAPPAVPQAKPGIFRRATPLLLSAGTGFFLYKTVTDNEFRATVEKAFPAAASVLNHIPSTDSSTSKATVEAAKAIDAEADNATNLPPGYDSVPNLLRKIEESKVNLTPAESRSELPTATKDKKSVSSSGDKDKKVEFSSMEDHKPTQRDRTPTNIQAEEEARTAGDGPISTIVQDKMTGPALAKASAIVTTTKPPADAKPSLTEVMTADDDSSSRSERGTDAPSVEKGTSGKEKLAKVLGKGKFRADEVEGPDVVDDSVYQKPSTWSFSKKSDGPHASKPLMERSKGRSWKSQSAEQSVQSPTSGADPEISALRAELESQAKWEAVRLQEAVRAQMIEDKKLAAKEAAAMAQKHAEHVARVREEAIVEAQEMLKVRTKEIKTKAEAERDADLARMLKTKEELLREELSLEYSTKERTETVEREKALVEAKSQVAALKEKFDSVVLQTEKAKEASKRASAAFLLRESVSSCRPLGSQLSEAGGREELGKLVVKSVPDSAVDAGVESIDSLRKGFHNASKHGLSVAMVPEGKTGTIWGHLLGALFSRLKISVADDTSAFPKTNEGRIRMAGRLVDAGDIGGAIVTLEGLNGLSAEVMADWVDSARARVAADLAADVLLADALIAQLSLTSDASAQDKRVSA